MGLWLSLALRCCVFGVLICLRRSIVCLLILFCLVTTGAAIGLGRQGAGGLVVVSRVSPIVGTVGDFLPVPYALRLPCSLSALGDLSPRF